MIELRSFSKTPEQALSKSHYYCDYIELIALCDCDDGVSISDIYDRFLDDRRISGIGSDEGSEYSERWSGYISNWFRELAIREATYGEFYPFTYDGNRLMVRQEFSVKNKIYVILLLCSMLQYIEQYHVLTSLFEKCSLYTMKGYLPDFAEVHLFGVSSNLNPLFTGSLENKYKVLAKKLGLTISSKPNVFREHDNGDGGLDIIAWIPFKDDPNVDRKLIFLGQSAAGKDWRKKQASVERAGNYLIDLPANTQNVLFVPYDFRDFERNFSESGEITSSLIFDRYRMLSLIKVDDFYNGDVRDTISDIIEYISNQEEDIV
ncbi:hypothetical protein ACK32P_10605 [Aeromonas dhakensis]|uniref:hypothetical protein n=1 Tax=Aeromonas dhakensis TaxID=196024 RepID=UPI00398672EE